MSHDESLFLVFKNSVPPLDDGSVKTFTLEELPLKSRVRVETYAPQVTVHLLDRQALRVAARHIHDCVINVLFGRVEAPYMTDAQRKVLTQYFNLGEFEDWIAFLSVTINPSGTEAEVRFLVAEDGNISQKHLTFRDVSASSLKSILVKNFLA